MRWLADLCLMRAWQQNASAHQAAIREKRPNKLRGKHRVLTSDDVREQATGLKTDPKLHLRRKAADELLTEQQSAMIEKMLGAGLDLRRKSDNVIVDLITGETKQLQGSRMCRFLPAVAKRERSEYLSSLEAFMSADEMKHARYSVITAGVPVVAMDPALRYTLQAFHRKLSRWASVAENRFGIQVIVRCTESTRKTLEQRGLIGKKPSYHLHANVVCRPKHYNRLAFQTFLSWTRRFFKTHWTDAGAVQNVREIVKYMIKPTDLADAPGEELVWLFEATEKLKFIQALGSFAEFRRGLKDDGLKTKSITLASGARETVLVKKDTRKPSEKAALRAELEAVEHDLIARIEREENDEAVVEWIERLLACQQDLNLLNTSFSTPNMIVAVLPPACRFIHYSTPAVLVAGFTSLSDLEAEPKFAVLREQALAHWADNGAPGLATVQSELALARLEFERGSSEKSQKSKKSRSAKKNQTRSRRERSASRVIARPTDLRVSVVMPESMRA
jgi:hypothetical protein